MGTAGFAVSRRYAVILVGALLRLGGSTQQGLYAMLPESGQLLLVDWLTGNATKVGVSLAEQGWLVPECTPAAIDPTGKWWYSLARNASLGPSSPWNVVSTWLVDGTTRTAAPLPDVFPPDLPACAHALFADGGWHVFTAAEIPSAGGYRAIATLSDFTFPYPPHSWTLVLNASEAALGAGRLLMPPSIAATASTLWISGTWGVAGASLQARLVRSARADSPLAPGRLLPLPAGDELAGLQVNPSGRVFGLLRSQSGRALRRSGMRPGVGALFDEARVAYFDDSGSGTPTLESGPIPIPPPFATSPSVVLTALMTDRGSLALLADGAHLAVVNATSGAPLSSVVFDCQPATDWPRARFRSQLDTAPPLPVVSSGGRSSPLAVASVCPTSLAYESFVF